MSSWRVRYQRRLGSAPYIPLERRLIPRWRKRVLKVAGLPSHLFKFMERKLRGSVCFKRGGRGRRERGTNHGVRALLMWTQTASNGRCRGAFLPPLSPRWGLDEKKRGGPAFPLLPLEDSSPASFFFPEAGGRERI